MSDSQQPPDDSKTAEPIASLQEELKYLVEEPDDSGGDSLSESATPGEKRKCKKTQATPGMKVSNQSTEYKTGETITVRTSTVQQAKVQKQEFATVTVKHKSIIEKLGKTTGTTVQETEAVKEFQKAPTFETSKKESDVIETGQVKTSETKYLGSQESKRDTGIERIVTQKQAITKATATQETKGRIVQEQIKSSSDEGIFYEAKQLKEIFVESPQTQRKTTEIQDVFEGQPIPQITSTVSEDIKEFKNQNGTLFQEVTEFKTQFIPPEKSGKKTDQSVLYITDTSESQQVDSEKKDEISRSDIIVISPPPRTYESIQLPTPSLPDITRISNITQTTLDRKIYIQSEIFKKMQVLIADTSQIQDHIASTIAPIIVQEPAKIQAILTPPVTTLVEEVPSQDSKMKSQIATEVISPEQQQMTEDIKAALTEKMSIIISEDKIQKNISRVVSPPPLESGKATPTLSESLHESVYDSAPMTPLTISEAATPRSGTPLVSDEFLTPPQSPTHESILKFPASSQIISQPISEVEEMQISYQNAQELIEVMGKSKGWLRLKVEEMIPELVVVGYNLEEALRLQKQHDDVLLKLQSKQQQIEELLSQADQLITTQKPQAEVYEAMAESLGEAWKDLNIQLEYRKKLLSQSVAFHRWSHEFTERMNSAFEEFNDAHLPQDVNTAQLALQRHHDIKKGILETSMHALNESQVLLERIKEGGVHADSRNRNITATACSGIEFLVEQLHDRKRQLEELWLQRKTKLEQCLELCILYQDLGQINDWLKNQGEEALKNTDLGHSVTTSELLQHDHNKLETDAKEMQDRVLRLVRTAEQLVHAGHYDGEAARTRALAVQSRCSNFLSKVENRRKLLAMSVAFFRTAQTALTKLDQIEVQLTTSELPLNSTALAQHHANLANTIEEITAPAIREGHILLERVGRDGSGVQGVANMIAELEGRRLHLSGLCTAHRFQNLEKSAAYNFFMDKYNKIYNWIVNIGEAFLNSHQDFGSVLAMAKDFLEHHEQLYDDMKDKDGEVQILLNSVPDLVKSGDQETLEISEKAEHLCNRWRNLCVIIDNRVRLSLFYVNFHKLAIQLASEIDALDEILKSEKESAQRVTEYAIKHNEERWIAITQIHQQLEDVGNKFITDAEKSADSNLDSKRAILCVQTLMDHFIQRKNILIQLWEAWQLRVSIGKEFKVQWHQYIEDARKTIALITEFEKQPLNVYIPADLGQALEAAKTLEKRLEDFLPMAKKAQAEIELRLKTAEMLALKGETQGQKDQIVNELLRVHQNFQKRIADYQVIYSMTIAFYRNLNELDKLIQKAEKQHTSIQLPQDVFQAEIVLKEYEASREIINIVIEVKEDTNLWSL